MRGMNASALQSMFQANHMGKAGLYDNQGGKMKKKQPMMLHSDPSILGMSSHKLPCIFITVVLVGHALSTFIYRALENNHG